MQFTCESRMLLHGVASVERAVSNNEAQPILTGILVEASGDQLRLVATDREIGIECTVPAVVGEPGRRVFDGKILAGIARKLGGDTTQCLLEGEGRMQIRSGGAKFDIQTRAADEFPSLPGDRDAAFHQIAPDELRRMIRHTTIAVARDDSRPFLTGVLVEVNGNDISMVATDANRLAMRTGKLVTAGDDGFAAIIPAKSLNEVLRLLDADLEEPVRFTVKEHQAVFRLPGIHFVSRIIDGRFPDYRRVFPSTLPLKFRVDRSQLLEAVERGSLMARKGPPIVRFRVSEGLLAVSATEAEVGQAYEEIPIDQEGTDLEMSYQARFLVDMLRIAGSDQLEIEMGDESKPAVIRPLGDDAYRYVVMPVRVG